MALFWNVEAHLRAGRPAELLQGVRSRIFRISSQSPYVLCDTCCSSRRMPNDAHVLSFSSVIHCSRHNKNGKDKDLKELQLILPLYLTFGDKNVSYKILHAKQDI